jgi:thiamine biosynthesis lipoprotein
MSAATTAPAPAPATAIFGAWSCTVRLVVGDERVLDFATSDLVNLLGRVDAAASRFRSDSELSRANEFAGRPLPVSRLLTDLVGAALDTAARTGGAVDPTVGSAMSAIGYDRDIAAVLAGGAATVRPVELRKNWADVRLNPAIGVLTVPAGATLDLGATAKAFTADLAARTMFARYGCPVLVELGGDLAVAGSRPGGWPVRVAEAEGAPGQTVTISRGGIATSTTTIRRWPGPVAGQAMHHIVDPATGAPADGPWRTVSVWAETALAANAASTAAIVLGSRAVGWLMAAGVAARLVDQAGAVTTVGDWPAITHYLGRAA